LAQPEAIGESLLAAAEAVTCTQAIQVGLRPGPLRLFVGLPLSLSLTPSRGPLRVRLLAASQAIIEPEPVTQATGQLPGLRSESLGLFASIPGQQLDTTAGFYPTAEEPYPHRVINRTA
jgi:hypothetical protein